MRPYLESSVIIKDWETPRTYSQARLNSNYLCQQTKLADEKMWSNYDESIST